MTSLRILKAGICSTVQDSGRPGFRAYGVPHSGALDRVALALANTLVGNEEHAAAIEMLYSGVSLRIDGGSVRIAVGGAEAIVQKASGAAPEALRAWQSATLRHGDTLRIGVIAESACAYLAIEGSCDVPPALGSVSTYLRGSLGGIDGRALKVGDVIPLKVSEASPRAEQRYDDAPRLAAPSELRIMSGPQSQRFDAASLQRLASVPYAVSTSSDRSGLRLEGEPLTHVGGFDLTSEGVAPGSIQVPGSGLPVILIGDHPTVGGYPKIATIISADVAAAGRLRIGSRVSFRLVDEGEARDARARATRQYEAALASLQALP